MKSSDKLKEAKIMLVEAIALIQSVGVATDNACIYHLKLLGGNPADHVACLIPKYAEDLEGLLGMYEELISGCERSDN